VIQILQPRIIPCLLLNETDLVKTTQFENPRYIGDPLNAVRIFNEKEVDELIFLDITTSRKKNPQPIKNNQYILDILSKISDECFMPLTFGGGIRDIEDIRKLLKTGVEKVSINTYGIENPSFIKEASSTFGSQSIIVSIDVKKHRDSSYEVFTHGGTKSTGLDPVSLAIEMESMGAGEILINSIDRDGTMKGYDIELIKNVSNKVNIPVIASGGAGKLEDFSDAINEGNASAAAAGAFFVFIGRKRAVLINYPNKKEIENILGQNKIEKRNELSDILE
jgi:cyclase